MAKPRRTPRLHRNKLLLWKYYERYKRKGWVTRHECIGGVWYRFLSAGVEKDGLRIYYVRDDDYKTELS